MSRGPKWTREDEDYLRSAWLTSESVDAISTHLTRTPDACYSRAARLKLGGKTPSNRVIVDRLGRRRDPCLAPDWIANQDDRYVSRCLAQGGFVTPKIIDGALVHVRPAGAFA